MHNTIYKRAYEQTTFVLIWVRRNHHSSCWLIQFFRATAVTSNDDCMSLKLFTAAKIPSFLSDMLYLQYVDRRSVYFAYLSNNRSKVLLVFSMEFFVFLDSASTWVNNFAVFSVSSCTWDVLERAFITYSQSSNALPVLRWHSSLEAKNCC